MLSRKIDRRAFLGGLAGVGIAIGTGGRFLGAGGRRMGGAPALPADPFQLGVASGDPLPDSVVLWTRLAVDPMSPEPMPAVQVPVRWEIAADERFGRWCARVSGRLAPTSATRCTSTPAAWMPGMTTSIGSASATT